MPIRPCIAPVTLAILVAGSIFNTPALAQQDKSKLAKKLANPVAALISVPFQLNDDRNIGPDDTGERWTLNIQPVVPFEISYSVMPAPTLTGWWSVPVKIPC